MNIKLLRRIQRQILKEPKQFHMDYVFVKKDEEFPGWSPFHWKIPNCGTAACLAGWALALSLDVKPSDVPTGPNKAWPHMIRAAKLLQISRAKGERLFLEYEWPDRFQGGVTPQTRAKRAVARIDFFIKTKGTDHE